MLIAAVIGLMVEAILRFGADVDLPWPAFSLAVAIAVVLAAMWWPWTKLSWAAWGWKLDEATFQTRSGVYRKTWKGVPRDRVQFVEVTSGPLQRSSGLATLVVRTAGVRTPAIHVQDLDSAIAEGLRSELSPVSERGADTPAPGHDA